MELQQTQQITQEQILNEVVKGLNICESERLKVEGYTNEAFFINDVMNKEYTYFIKEKQKYFYINCGSSGVFMVLKSNGEIYNIKGYGTPDLNKKIKANLGNIKDYVNNLNILDIDKIRILLSKRYNYLR